jgi:hypothetical protein
MVALRRFNEFARVWIFAVALVIIRASEPGIRNDIDVVSLLSIAFLELA